MNHGVHGEESDFALKALKIHILNSAISVPSVVKMDI
jgi:hypothetical protein